MKRLLFTLAAAGLFGSISSASAQWIYQGNESAFGDDSLHIALTASGNYALGLRCKGSTLEAIYMTPDRSFDKDSYAFANMTKPTLKLRVDNDAVVDVEAELIDVDGKAAVLADIDVSLAHSVRDAKRRVAVVVQILQDNYHEQSFNVRGSTKATGRMLTACGLAE